MAEARRPIQPNPPRWQPNPDPSSIHVPGLDTSASVLDQIEQMEQLITIKLQKVDENFSKIHHLLANKLLPAVKRYAVGTEPVREAAKFWTSFYEQAAQTRIPSFEDYSTVNEQSSEQEQQHEEANITTQSSVQATPLQSHSYEPSMASNESSFMPGQAAFSSTPATARGPHTFSSFASQKLDDPSWSASLESPFVRLDREFQDFSKQDDNSPGPSMPNKIPALNSIPKKLNPFLPKNIDPRDWSGVVDLRDRSILTPKRRSGKSPARRNPMTPKNGSDDESFDGLPPGMSPPVLMSPARPPRSSAELGLLKLGQTPMKEASERIRRDLIRDLQRKSGAQARQMHGYGNSGVESSMSTMPTPPSFSRYHPQDTDTNDSMTIDSSLESMMRRVGLNMPSNPGTASTPGLRLRSRTAAPGSLLTSAPNVDSASIPTTPADTPPLPEAHSPFPLDSDSDSDSLDEINNTAHPSAAFLMASQGADISDDSFGSSNHSADSLTEEDANLGLVPIHPFARSMDDDGFDDEDSFDDDGFAGHAAGEFQEETLFGVPPVPRFQAEQGDQLRMLGEDLLDDTIGIGAQIARTGRVEESPTPASWAGGRG